MSKEKRFEPTSRKLNKARNEGDVAKSRDLTMAIGTTIGFLSMFYLSFSFTEMRSFIESSFLIDRDFHSDNMLLLLTKSIWMVITPLLPVLLLVSVTVVLTEALQVGVRFSIEGVTFKLSRLNPVSGLRRIFGFEEAEQGSFFPMRLIYDVGKSCAYILGITVVIGGFSYYLLPQIFFGDFQEAGDVIESGFQISLRLALSSMAVFFLIGCCDLLLAQKRRVRRLRMDVEEFKKEIRETEGNPELKSMRKGLHQELLIQSVIEGVRRSRVVVVSKKGE